MTEQLVSYEAVEGLLQESSTVAVARFTAGGALRRANARFYGLAPLAVDGALLPQLVAEGQRDQVAAAVAGDAEPPRVLDLRGGADEPVALQVTWVKEADDILIVGEAQAAEQEASQAVLAKLNRRLMDLARENAEKTAELEQALVELRAERDALELAKQQIDLLVREDPLTGLVNRRHLEEVLAGEVERVRRQGNALAVILADLDHLREVNDVYGHTAGDDVLRSAAQCFKEAARTIDVVGRYGGEEFLLVLPDTDAAQAKVLAERLLGRLRETPVAFRQQPVTGSFGVTDWRADDSLDSFMNRADAALSDAKHRGRDQIRVL